MQSSVKIVINPNSHQMAGIVDSLPKIFSNDEGVIIYKGRNELRQFEYNGRQYVAKSFHTNPINRFVYGVLRKSKAERSYLHALRLREIGVGTPEPVAFMDVRKWGVLTDSYYFSNLSECSHVYVEIFSHKFECEDDLMREIGRKVAVMHNNGLAHLDFGRGNILFEETKGGGVKIDIVDLNRMYFGELSMEKGCKNLERLPANPHQHRLIAEEYAKERGFDADKCYQLIRTFRSTQPGKIDAEGF